ncbi:lysozyme inhibitor LprI family protein [Nitratifractor sp.]
MKIRWLFPVLILCSVTAAQADDIYDRTFDTIYLSNRVYVALDNRLANVYRRLRRYLGPQGRRILVTSEKDWIHRRDHRCAYPETHSVDIACAIRETRERLRFLEARLRECETVGCRIDRLY